MCCGFFCPAGSDVIRQPRRIEHNFGRSTYLRNKNKHPPPPLKIRCCRGGARPRPRDPPRPTSDTSLFSLKNFNSYNGGSVGNVVFLERNVSGTFCRHFLWCVFAHDSVGNPSLPHISIFFPSLKQKCSKHSVK